MVIAMRWPGAALLVSTFSVPGSFGHCAGCSGDAEGPATTGSFAPLRVAGYQGMVARAGEAAGCIATAKDGPRAIQHYLGHRSIDSPVR
jgi:hypothetical protein